MGDVIVQHACREIEQKLAIPREVMRFFYVLAGIRLDRSPRLPVRNHHVFDRARLVPAHHFDAETAGDGTDLRYPMEEVQVILVGTCRRDPSPPLDIIGIKRS